MTTKHFGLLHAIRALNKIDPSCAQVTKNCRDVDTNDLWMDHSKKKLLDISSEAVNGQQTSPNKMRNEIQSIRRGQGPALN